jgi:DNA-binding PadR family transcriptional regulator
MVAMQEPTFLILTALAGGPLHGYGVIQEVTSLSGGEVTLRAGTLYGALDRLVERALIAIDREEAVDGRLRRYYRLTEGGARALATEADRMRRNATAATARLDDLFGNAFGGATT